jgi:predicted DNA-binding transcriptional regulator AlpA
MKHKNYRAVIYASDIAILLGKSVKTGYRHISQMRKYFGKERDMFITVSEFCDYTGISESDVYTHFDAIGEGRRGSGKEE